MNKNNKDIVCGMGGALAIIAILYSIVSLLPFPDPDMIHGEVTSKYSYAFLQMKRAAVTTLFIPVFQILNILRLSVALGLLSAVVLVGFKDTLGLFKMVLRVLLPIALVTLAAQLILGLWKFGLEIRFAYEVWQLSVEHGADVHEVGIVFVAMFVVSFAVMMFFSIAWCLWQVWYCRLAARFIRDEEAAVI